MSAKPCAYCSKPAYPIEQLKCLDKVYHKTCFKCTECGTTLNLRTFKGLDRMPYCEAHVPVIKHTHTGVYDTPQWRRRFRADHPLINGEEIDIPEISIPRSPSPPPTPPPAPAPPVIEPPPPLTPKDTPKGGESRKHGRSRAGAGILKEHKRPTPTPASPPPLNSKTGVSYRALYDYDSNDVDETSCVEGDLVVDCTGVDSGWLTGTVVRTGLRGLLPANYLVYTTD